MSVFLGTLRMPAHLFPRPLSSPPFTAAALCRRLLQVKDKDQYGRNVSVCLLGSEDLNGWLVSNGYAVSYR